MIGRIASLTLVIRVGSLARLARPLIFLQPISSIELQELPGVTITEGQLAATDEGLIMEVWLRERLGTWRASLSSALTA
jgi:hypothetical protein